MDEAKKDMYFYIMESDLSAIVGVVDTFKSAIWTNRYFAAGDFELYVPATDAMIALLINGRYVFRGDTSWNGWTDCMIIQSVQITTDAEQGNYLIVKGRDVSNILNRRIIWKQITLSGYVEEVIESLIKKNVTQPEITERTIPQIDLAPKIGIEDKVKIQFTGQYVDEAVQKLCKRFKLGYRMRFNPQSKRFKFEIYKGADRTYSQNTNPHVVFSADYENLLSTDYTNSAESMRNVAKVAGEGEGVDRKTTSVGEASGLARFETWIDARNQSSNEGEFPPDIYLGILQAQGIQALNELQNVESIDGQVAPNATWKINVDYFLGDLVEIENEYGMQMEPRIIEVIESEDDAGHSVIPTFKMDEEEEEE